MVKIPEAAVRPTPGSNLTTEERGDDSTDTSQSTTPNIETPESKVVKPTTRARANKAIERLQIQKKTTMKKTPVIQNQRNVTTTSRKSKSPNSATKTTERGKKKTGVV